MRLLTTLALLIMTALMIMTRAPMTLIVVASAVTLGEVDQLWSLHATRQHTNHA